MRRSSWSQTWTLGRSLARLWRICGRGVGRPADLQARCRRTSIWTRRDLWRRVHPRDGDLWAHERIAPPRSRSCARVRAVVSFECRRLLDLAAIDAAYAEALRQLPQWGVDDLIPSEGIPDGLKTDDARRMGLLRWRDMFTLRQQLVMATAVIELKRSCWAQATMGVAKREP